ncbi:alpha/beta fold hydrolase [Aspergillus clavatus NRRL 1]|uniref:AB hydrolase-1 domain-containing protein n=1 Tax=Aspergillus clavatus (strain ATCC 1007 / CBS 513.65 / DSM 816 / NCTC 3887 / NRRL 1 / QM 1276 / 107) TaxID=344612 RepID=A1CK86_ASPCL|nr:uncharacterized protein ACLA_037680 [Aspergillus clavatus NRRL 1]EAW09560.1 conserved hypothetical protein [Aspergillus clavatus NRRL 1]
MALPPSALISSRRFHRRVILNTAYGALTVTYADIGCATGPTVLFMPGMFASRYLGIPMHVVAEHAGVRLLVVDRPGMGGSTDVPLAQRVAVWVDMLPRLLEHLSIPKVNLVSHSAGTIYLLNTWAQCREFVGPVITLLAPWVDPAHSHVMAMQMAQYVPTKAFAVWHHIPRFFITQASPMLASSGALVRQISSNGNQTAEDRSFLDAQWRRVERDYGVPHEEQAEFARLALSYMFAENTVGGNSEALQCLRKDGVDWGVCSDYARCAQMLAAREQSTGVTVRTYFATKDALVGNKGQKYFEECWQAPGMEAINFVSTTVKDTDHDTLVQSIGVWEEIFSSLR